MLAGAAKLIADPFGRRDGLRLLRADPVQGRGERGQALGKLRVPCRQPTQERMLPGRLPLGDLRLVSGLLGLCLATPIQLLVEYDVAGRRATPDRARMYPSAPSAKPHAPPDSIGPFS